MKLLKLMYKFDNFFYRISFLLMLYYGWNAYDQSRAGNLVFVGFYVFFAFFFGRCWLKADEKIAENNASLEELDKPSIFKQLEEMKPEDINAYSVNANWDTLREKYSDLRDIQIMQKREAEMTNILEQTVDEWEDWREYLELKVFTPVGENDKLVTRVEAKTDTGREILLRMVRVLNGVDVKPEIKIIQEEK